MPEQVAQAYTKLRSAAVELLVQSISMADVLEKYSSRGSSATQLRSNAKSALLAVQSLPLVHGDGTAHTDSQCFYCGEFPICGARYKCTVCSDVNICNSCESSQHHNASHPLLKMRIPEVAVAGAQLLHKQSNEKPAEVSRFETVQFIRQMALLLKENRDLILSFNSLLPSGYKVDVSQNGETVVHTPEGVVHVACPLVATKSQEPELTVKNQPEAHEMKAALVAEDDQTRTGIVDDASAESSETSSLVEVEGVSSMASSSETSPSASAGVPFTSPNVNGDEPNLTGTVDDTVQSVETSSQVEGVISMALSVASLASPANNNPAVLEKEEQNSPPAAAESSSEAEAGQSVTQASLEDSYVVTESVGSGSGPPVVEGFEATEDSFAADSSFEDAELQEAMSHSDTAQLEMSYVAVGVPLIISTTEDSKVPHGVMTGTSVPFQGGVSYTFDLPEKLPSDSSSLDKSKCSSIPSEDSSRSVPLDGGRRSLPIHPEEFDWTIVHKRDADLGASASSYMSMKSMKQSSQSLASSDSQYVKWATELDSLHQLGIAASLDKRLIELLEYLDGDVIKVRDAVLKNTI
eukprot:CAMPEP_0184643528 /NCGR_PEP_ID=MMETSP0308-20130426/377_1 /TAXON_ID=38269 /ORGANISM="Gloeochaete witrockiana, Strain SAG 46.84" /LENGTH=578 /DNA_ID=CAMNT_0027071523 /DNA_START=345 /DNA_END=2081 /DNA_ORIENTATION=-